MELTPELLLRAYAFGVFPMAENRAADNLYWIDPEMRGVLPLENFHIPRSLRKAVRKAAYRITGNTAFRETMEKCAESVSHRPETWINDTILELYSDLHAMGFAHSIECWDEDHLVGGLYGVSLGGAFFGESMFSRRTDASKVALVHLVARLRLGGFKLLDCQFVTDHLRQFGTVEIPRDQYRDTLADAVQASARFPSDLTEDQLASFVHSTTQTS